MKIHGVTGNLAIDGILSAEELEELNQSQLNDVSAVNGSWQEHGYGQPYPLVIKPTGYGKGRVIDALLHPNQEPGVALLIVGTKNILVEQNQESLRSLVLEETGESRFSILPDTSGPVIVATWQSIEAYRKKFLTPPEIDLVIVDEVHNAGTKKRLRTLKWLQPKRVVGLTATAYRASGDLRTPEHYGFQPIEEITDTLPACIERRWLSPLMGLCIDTEIILPQDVMTGDIISGKKLYREMRHHPDLFAGIAQEIGTRFLPSGMKTIVVVNRVLEEACVIYKHLENMGFTVGLAVNQQASRMLKDSYVTNGSIERYKLPHDDPNSIQVLISPQVIGEGFDAQATECVVWASPTNSSLRYTQVMGRGARRCPGKAYCLVVDFVYMIEGYGYSMNFAQFFKHKEIKELEGGFMYVGPSDAIAPTIIPQSFTTGGRVVAIANLERPIIRDAGDWITAMSIAKSLNRTHRWVKAKLQELGHEPEIRRAPRIRDTEYYEPSVLQELRRLDNIPESGGWLTIGELTRLVGKSEPWVVKTLKDLNYACELRKQTTNGNTVLHYPSSALEALKKCNETPSSGDWQTLLGLEKLLGVSRPTISKLIKEINTPSEMRSTPAGRIAPHFPPEIVEQLRKKIDAPDAGDWLSVRAIATKLNRSDEWVNRHLEDNGIIAELRRSKTSLASPHYPPNVLDLLSRENITRGAKDWLTKSEIARKMMRSNRWVTTRLALLGINGEMRTIKNGKSCVHFPPESITKLSKLSSE